MIRRLAGILLFAALIVVGGMPLASASDSPIEVVVVSGTLDQRLIDFVIDAIEESEAGVVVLQLDSAATVDASIDELIALVADPPLPVVVYAGPDPARVSGGALRLLAAAGISGSAPGVVLGPAEPTLAGDAPDLASVGDDLPDAVIEGSVTVSDDLGGFLDLVEPSIGQFVVGLDGRSVEVGGAAVTLVTAQEGGEGIVPVGPVTFVGPGLIDTTIRLGVGPEVAFFFLVAGLSLAIFEFYAAGPGVAAATAVVCLLISAYGIAVLPVQWWAVALVPLGLLLYTVDFQRNDLGLKSLLGTVMLLVGGLAFTDAAPQITQTWWIVLIIVVGTALWFGFALTTVVRARFSTQTIGRDHLIGETGTAETAIAPEGTVVLEGARWRARSTRGSGIAAGDPVVVKAVEGIVLEVDPPE